MGVYNPNDELRAIVQRKQYEVQALLKQHVAEDDRLQVCVCVCVYSRLIAAMF